MRGRCCISPASYNDFLRLGIPLLLDEGSSLCAADSLESIQNVLHRHGDTWEIDHPADAKPLLGRSLTYNRFFTTIIGLDAYIAMSGDITSQMLDPPFRGPPTIQLANELLLRTEYWTAQSW